METDLDYYTRSIVHALQSARRASSPEVRRMHEQLANAFAMQLYRLEATPAAVTPELRLRPAQLAA